METHPSLKRKVITVKGLEEKRAAENCRLTKILGWSLIATFCFSIVSAFFTDKLTIDLLMLLGGISINRGSQAWVRFYCFLSSAMAIFGCLEIVLSYINQSPLVYNRQWIDHNDPQFWTGYVGPIGIVTGLAILCILTLRARKLVFWTKSSRRWGGTTIAIVLLFSLIGIVTHVLQKSPHQQLANEFQSELEALRHYAKTTGARHSPTTLDPLVEKLKQNKRVEEVIFDTSPNSSMTIYSDSKSSRLNGWNYDEFIKLAPGKWIQLKARLKE